MQGPRYAILLHSAADTSGRRNVRGVGHSTARNLAGVNVLIQMDENRKKSEKICIKTACSHPYSARLNDFTSRPTIAYDPVKALRKWVNVGAKGSVYPIFDHSNMRADILRGRVEEVLEVVVMAAAIDQFA